MTNYQLFSVVESLLLSLACGLILGLEREIKSKSAGLKTLMMVTFASTLFTAISIHFPGAPDPSRIAAQIVIGIGFLTGGAIVQSNQAVYGITTASKLWMASAMGMFLGTHWNYATFLLLLLAEITLWILGTIEESWLEKSLRFEVEVKAAKHMYRPADFLQKFLSESPLEPESFQLVPCDSHIDSFRVVFCGTKEDYRGFVSQVFKSKDIYGLRELH